MRGSFKPNHIPANYITIGQRVKELSENPKLRVDLKTYRKTIGDLCDFCLKDIRVSRNFMFLRKKGWKFSCRKCYKKNHNEDHPKDHKIIMEWKPPILKN